jgi:hypothetical protein
MRNVKVRNYKKLRARRVERTRPTALQCELILPASKEEFFNPILQTAWLNNALKNFMEVKFIIFYCNTLRV